MEVMCYLYIYFQGFQTYRKDYSKENLVVAGRYFNACKEILEIKNNAEAYNYIAADYGKMYLQIEPMSRNSTHYLPHQGVKQWIDMVDKAYKKSLQS